MEGRDTKLDDFIRSRTPLIVPKYQRAYSWNRQVDDLLSDLQALIDIRTQNSNNKDIHFFGSFVLIQKTNGDYELVDGQQRMTTFMIAFMALKDALDKIARAANKAKDLTIEQRAKTLVDELFEDYITFKKNVGTERIQTPRLKLSKSDDDFFCALVSGAPFPTTLDSHILLRKSYKEVEKKLVKPIVEDTSLDLKQKLERLVDIKDIVLNACLFVEVVSQNHSEAFKVFSALNDRGKPLMESDLMRSHTLALVEKFPSEGDKVEKHWNSLRESTKSSTNLDDYLRHYYASYQGSSAPRKNMWDKFNANFLSSLKPPVQTQPEAHLVEKQISDLHFRVSAYNDIKEGKWPYPTPTVKQWYRRRLDRLIKALDHTLCIPLLLTVHRQLDEKAFSEVVYILERASFRYITVLGERPNKLSDIYNKQIREIEANAASYSVSKLRDDLHNLMQTPASNEAFRLRLVERLQYSKQGTRIKTIRHFLTTLEAHYHWAKNNQGVGPHTPDTMHDFNLDDVEIEHIYPQSPTKPDVDVTLEPSKHLIGNLTFWAGADNKAQSNRPFSVKQPFYIDSKVQLTQDVGKYSAWTSGDFQNRQKELIDLAVIIFSV